MRNDELDDMAVEHRRGVAACNGACGCSIVLLYTRFSKGIYKNKVLLFV